MRTIKTLIVLLITLFATGTVMQAKEKIFKLENRFLSRQLSVKDGQLRTVLIENKLIGTKLYPLQCNEFALRLSDGTDKIGTDRLVNTEDFRVENVQDLSDNREKRHSYQFVLYNSKEDMKIILHYELKEEESYCRKFLQIIPNKEVTIEQVDVESIALEDAFQNYTIKNITAQAPSQWKPGLGQPIYTLQTGTFWGLEFPAAYNTVNNNLISCSYLIGKTLQEGEIYTSYKSVVGMADDIEYIDDAFYTYIKRIRKRPLRLQIQYNSWFDYGNHVTEKQFVSSIEKIQKELVANRKCPPLSAYVIDDGWQDISATADWSDTVWTIDKAKFSPYFSESVSAVHKANSQLGVWLSPASILGGLSMVPRMKEYGFESLSYGMSMTGRTYMDKLEQRVCQLAEKGISYFKFDGLFGHLNIRDFELNGRGIPAVPQLNTEGFTSNDRRLNASRYDEVKLYYMTAATERLIRVFNHLTEINPEIFIAITNGAYLSPWWLQYIDVVWLINAGDAASGNNRTDELVYRDNIYYQIWTEENTKFPMNAIFNHEPKKTKFDETADSFKKYLYMNLSRGTGFIELYIKTHQLSSSDWDVLAEVLKWSHKFFPAFQHVKMHGGSPRHKEVYGYSGWGDEMGYVSIHNPLDKTQKYTFTLDRALGLNPDNSTVFRVSSPISRLKEKNLKEEYRCGETISIELNPGEIVLINFENE